MLLSPAAVYLFLICALPDLRAVVMTCRSADAGGDSWDHQRMHQLTWNPTIVSNAAMSAYLSSLSTSRKAIGLALLGFFMFSCSDLGTKYLSELYSTIQILFLVGIFGTIILLVLALFGLFDKAFISMNYHLHITRGFLLFLSTSCYIYGFSLGLTLAEYYTLVFTVPIFATLLATIVHKETAGIQRWLVILAGFAAIVTMAQPGIIGISRGTAAVMLGVVSAAVAVLLIRSMGKDESVFLLGLFPQLFYAFGTFVFVPANFVWPQPSHWVIFILTGASSSIAAALVAAGYARANRTASIAPINYSQMLWGVIFGWLVFDDIPKPSVLLGAAIIIFTGIYLIRIESTSN
jgi:drug/metabolite transporter (DMT)-like permease